MLQLLESFEDETHFVCITRFFKDGDLLDYYDFEEEKSLDKFKSIILQVAKGIQSLHSLNIIHRDIKASNIFVDSGSVCIGDFGTAQQLETADSTLSFKIGTPGYLPPELIAGKGYGLGYDVWSLGCLAHFLLCEETPHWHDDRALYYMRVCNQQLDLSDERFTALGEQGKSLLRGMLTKDPKARLTISEVLAHPFLAL